MDGLLLGGRLALAYVCARASLNAEVVTGDSFFSVVDFDGRQYCWFLVARGLVCADYIENLVLILVGVLVDDLLEGWVDGKESIDCEIVSVAAYYYSTIFMFSPQSTYLF